MSFTDLPKSMRDFTEASGAELSSLSPNERDLIALRNRLGDHPTKPELLAFIKTLGQTYQNEPLAAELLLQLSRGALWIFTEEFWCTTIDVREHRIEAEASRVWVSMNNATRRAAANVDGLSEFLNDELYGAYASQAEFLERPPSNPPLLLLLEVTLRTTPRMAVDSDLISRAARLVGRRSAVFGDAGAEVLGHAFALAYHLEGHAKPGSDSRKILDALSEGYGQTAIGAQFLVQIAESGAVRQSNMTVRIDDDACAYLRELISRLPTDVRQRAIELRSGWNYARPGNWQPFDGTPDVPRSALASVAGSVAAASSTSPAAVPSTLAAPPQSAQRPQSDLIAGRLQNYITSTATISRSGIDQNLLSDFYGLPVAVQAAVLRRPELTAAPYYLDFLGALLSSGASNAAGDVAIEALSPPQPGQVPIGSDEDRVRVLAGLLGRTTGQLSTSRVLRRVAAATLGKYPQSVGAENALIVAINGTTDLSGTLPMSRDPDRDVAIAAVYSLANFDGERSGHLLQRMADRRGHFVYPVHTVLCDHAAAALKTRTARLASAASSVAAHDQNTVPPEWDVADPYPGFVYTVQHLQELLRARVDAAQKHFGVATADERMKAFLREAAAAEPEADPIPLVVDVLTKRPNGTEYPASVAHVAVELATRPELGAIYAPILANGLREYQHADVARRGTDNDDCADVRVKIAEAFGLPRFHDAPSAEFALSGALIGDPFRKLSTPDANWRVREAALVSLVKFQDGAGLERRLAVLRQVKARDEQLRGLADRYLNELQPRPAPLSPDLARAVAVQAGASRGSGAQQQKSIVTRLREAAKENLLVQIAVVETAGDDPAVLHDLLQEVLTGKVGGLPYRPEVAAKALKLVDPQKGKGNLVYVDALAEGLARYQSHDASTVSGNDSHAPVRVTIAGQLGQPPYLDTPVAGVALATALAYNHKDPHCTVREIALNSLAAFTSPKGQTQRVLAFADVRDHDPSLRLRDLADAIYHSYRSSGQKRPDQTAVGSTDRTASPPAQAPGASDVSQLIERLHASAISGRLDEQYHLLNRAVERPQIPAILREVVAGVYSTSSDGFQFRYDSEVVNCAIRLVRNHPPQNHQAVLDVIDAFKAGLIEYHSVAPDRGTLCDAYSRGRCQMLEALMVPPYTERAEMVSIARLALLGGTVEGRSEPVTPDESWQVRLKAIDLLCTITAVAARSGRERILRTVASNDLHREVEQEARLVLEHLSGQSSHPSQPSQPQARRSTAPQDSRSSQQQGSRSPRSSQLPPSPAPVHPLVSYLDGLSGMVRDLSSAARSQKEAELAQLVTEWNAAHTKTPVRLRRDATRRTAGPQPLADYNFGSIADLKFAKDDEGAKEKRDEILALANQLGFCQPPAPRDSSKPKAPKADRSDLHDVQSREDTTKALPPPGNRPRTDRDVVASVMAAITQAAAEERGSRLRRNGRHGKGHG